MPKFCLLFWSLAYMQVQAPPPPLPTTIKSGFQPMKMWKGEVEGDRQPQDHSNHPTSFNSTTILFGSGTRGGSEPPSFYHSLFKEDKWEANEHCTQAGQQLWVSCVCNHSLCTKETQLCLRLVPSGIFSQQTFLASFRCQKALQRCKPALNVGDSATVFMCKIYTLTSCWGAFLAR